MKLEAKKLLFDILEAGSAIKRFVQGKKLEHYQTDEMLSAAVERKFEIIGESLNRQRRSDEELLEQIREYRKVIGFRNLLAHGYDAISDEVVWEICQYDLDVLLEDVKRLLAE